MARLCVKCGKPLEVDANFCTVCGTNNSLDIVQNDSGSNTNTATTPVSNNTSTINISTPTSGIPLVTPTSTVASDTQPIMIPNAVEAANNDRSTTTSTLQSMPEIVSSTPVTTTDNNVLDKPSVRKAIKRKRRGNDAKIIYIIAAIAGSVFVLIILIFLLVFLLSFKDNFSGNENTEPGSIFTEKNSFRIGNADFGFVSVPNSWVPYKQDESNRTLQYTDGTGWIVTLYSVGIADASPQDWATSIVGQMKNAGAEDIGLETTSVEEYSGYKVFAYYKNVSTYLAAWVLDGNDGKTHYIAIEGPNRFDDNYDIIYTFSLAK